MTDHDAAEIRHLRERIHLLEAENGNLKEELRKVQRAPENANEGANDSDQADSE